LEGATAVLGVERYARIRTAARDPVLVALAGLVVVAAALRFSTLDLQSYYTDEAYTVWLVKQSPIDMVHGIVRTESTPPLYYSVAWVWSRLFGTGEVGLRSLSALAGTATVLVAFLAGSQLLSRRAGLVVAALAAVSPFMVWYSQEARSYALYTLLATLSIYLYARLRREPRPALVVAWAAVCEASIWTHYFAVYLVATEAALLLLLVPRARRAVAAALGAVALASLPVAWLAILQHRRGNPEWIAQLALGNRIRSASEEFIGGHYQMAHPRVVVALLAILVVGLVAGARSRAVRPRMAEAALLGIGVVGLPLVAAALGKDYWLSRNVMPAWLCAALVVGVGVAGMQRQWLTWLFAGALVLLALAPTVRTFQRAEFQRKNWRGLARCLGPQRRERALVLRSEAAALVLGIYRPDTARLGGKAKLVDDVDVVDLPPSNLHMPTQFAGAGTSCARTIPVQRFTATKPTRVSASDFLAPSRESDAEVRLDQPTDAAAAKG